MLNREMALTRTDLVRRLKVRTVIVMAVVISLLFAGISFVSYNLYQVHAASTAKEEYGKIYKAYSEKIDELDEALESIVGTLVECRESVADQSVCDTLEKVNAQGLELSNLKRPKVEIYNKKTSEIRAESKQLIVLTEDIETARSNITVALEPVARSQIDKVRLEVNAAIENAEKNLAQSQTIVDTYKNQVKDPNVITRASEAIAAVRNQIDGTKAVQGADTAAYHAAIVSLNDALDVLAARTREVQYSHSVWLREKAEAEARASAEASASAAQQINPGDLTFG